MNTNIAEDRFLNIRELAQRHGVTPDCLYKRIRAGEFPAGYRFGASRRWKLSELEAWESAHAISA